MFGSLLKNALKSPRSLTIFNFAMSGLLVLSVIPVVVEIVETLA